MILDLAREISQTLSHNKLRTALTGFAVAWGIFLLIILLGLSRGVVNNFSRWQNPESAGAMMIWNGYTTVAHQGYKVGRKIEIQSSDLQPIYDENRKFTRSVTAAKRLDSAMVSTQTDYLSEAMEGVFPETAKANQITDITGRFINQADIDGERKVIVLHQQYAHQLFPNLPSAVGQRVNAMGLSWLIVGTYDHEWQRSIYIPFTSAMKLSGNDGKVSTITVHTQDLKSEADGTAEEEGIRQTLGRQHHFEPTDQSAVHVWNRFNNYLKQQTANSILTTAVWILGILTLLSGIVGVSNIMFVSVRERTHEIGIRRAIGAKPRNILVQIVAESASITTMFGYIGIVGGMAVLLVINKMFGESNMMRDPNVDLSVALEVTIVLIVAGALAGLFPAIKATKVKPVEALRDE